MYTIKEVIEGLKSEQLSNNFELKAGDINFKEHGGLLIKKGSLEGIVEFILFTGLEVIEGEAWLDDIIDDLPEIWSFADGRNCGFTIGYAMYSLECYSDFLRERGSIRNINAKRLEL